MWWLILGCVPGFPAAPGFLDNPGHDFDGDGFTEGEGDCDDARGESWPGAPEICDGLDNDCDGEIDWPTPADAPSWYADGTCDGLDNDCDDLVDDDDPDMTGPATWYRDADHDGYGVADNTLDSCTQPTGYVALGTDCDDANDWIHPSQLESCDGVDENCDGTIDEGVTTRYYLDTDGDGYGLLTTWLDACDHPTGYVENADDCNDADPLAWMGGIETCDGSDNDCDGSTDPTDSAGCVQYYYDYDGDGYGISNMNTCECSGSGYYTATESGDCDDADALVNSGAGNCGLMGTIDVSAADGVFTASGAASDFGEWGTIAGGEDLNQDGWADLVFSSPGANSNTGEIYVSYGPHTGGALDLTVHADVTLTGSGPGAYAGGGQCIK